MKYMTSKEIRNTWLNFFKDHGHKIEKSASLIPVNDPTLLWINAGVAALKPYFDGREIPSCRRLVNIQKAIRTNDIDNVGRTSRHHTLFEMLGNFSIGDYFRDEAIAMGFDLLTNEKYFGFPKEKLYITYYPDDKDTLNKWISLGIDPSHMVPSYDNFWEIGEGPCGPDTEIYFDRGEKYDPNHLGEKLIREDIDNDRYIEIWNIVLSQFNSKAGQKRSEYKELPSKNIDTGAGLERFASILQNTDSNFESDLFLPIIKKIEKITGKKYDENKMSFRVIADHIKACSFAISDGATFSNEGRGYVLRRLLRRAMSHGHKLGINKPFLTELIDNVLEIYGEFYPNLISKKSQITSMIKSEEDRFLLTLNKGETIIKEMAKNHNIDAFKLYDTYGYPVELTIEIANDLNEKIDLDKFKLQMKEQKEKARNARENVNSMGSQSFDLMNCNVKSEFLYENRYIKSKVVALFKDGVKVNEIKDEGDAIFDVTTFYATQGGQIADIGTFVNKENKAEIVDVSLAPYKQHLHHFKVLDGVIKINDTFMLKPNKKRRMLIARNHTGTHLLNAALNKLLSNDIEQKGSQVTDSYLRFDFNYNDKISKEKLLEIENEINTQIIENLIVNTEILPIEEAKKLGAKMVFTEKYGNVVRVVSIGDYSKEFCGGTHVSSLIELGLFKIESCETIASGIKRIVAHTSKSAIDFVQNTNIVVNEALNNLAIFNLKELNKNIINLKQDIQNKKQDIKNLNSTFAKYLANDISKNFYDYNGHKVLVKVIDNINRELLIQVADLLKTNNSNYIFNLYAYNQNDISAYIVTDIKSISAGEKMKKVSALFKGHGGGNPKEANGKVSTLDNFDDVYQIIHEGL